MFWRSLLMLVSSSFVRPHPTSCAEDSQCSSGFYCQANSHLCIECLRCELLKREVRIPREVCIKSVTECGVCLKGLVQVDGGDDGYAQCIPAGAESSGGVLPPYGWAAIAVSLVLMVVILCLFAKMKTFKVAYAARTSVQSLHAVPLADIPCAPPPPYHDHRSSSPASQSEALEMRKLVETPQPRESPPPEMRACENSDSQNARVFNNPVYVRSPQNGTRYNSPESAGNEARGDNIVSAASIAAEPTWIIDAIADNNVDTTNHPDGGKVYSKINAIPRKTRAENEFQDTNNNFSARQEAAASQSPNSSGAYCNGVVAGPSFIINVVENINNAAITHTEYHT